MEYSNKLIGKIHSVESFGTLDGPGIRYVIFMQGCSLRCKYCHNPDSWDFSGGNAITVDEIVDEVKSYKPYMDSSGGGITVSGGEPLHQAKFLVELFKRLKEIGIHTALDTSGFTSIDPVIEELLIYTDLVLLDIKHINNALHEELTGVSNARTLEFLKYLKDKCINTWIRYVIVDGYTANLIYAEQLAKYIHEYTNIEQVELLPYHQFGEHKWEMLGYSYELKGISTPTVQCMELIKKIFQDYKIKTIY